MRTVLSEHLSELANHIRAKAGTQSSMTWPDGFIYTIEHIDTGGGTNWKTEFAKNLSGQSSMLPDDLAALRAYCFYGKPITDAQLAGLPSSLTTIGEHCFDSCTALRQVDLSNKSITAIQNATFKGCSGMTSLDLSNNNIQSIGSTDVLNGCSSLTSIDLSGNTASLPKDFANGLSTLTVVRLPSGSIGESAFRSCSNLATVQFQAGLQAIGKEAFMYNAIQVIDVPLSSTDLSIGQGAFDRSSAIQSIKLPTLTSLSKWAFCNTSTGTSAQSALIQIDMGWPGRTLTTGFPVDTFGGHYHIEALVLRYDAVPTYQTNAFRYTNLLNSGYFYVPRALISAYEAAGTWSGFAGRYRALEDYTDDGTLTGNFILPT